MSIVDSIQERCIAKMQALKLNPNQVATRVNGRVNRSHVCDFLSRRAGMGSHKLQHVLTALQLGLSDLPAKD